MAFQGQILVKSINKMRFADPYLFPKDLPAVGRDKCPKKLWRNRRRKHPHASIHHGGLQAGTLHRLEPGPIGLFKGRCKLNRMLFGLGGYFAIGQGRSPILPARIAETGGSRTLFGGIHIAWINYNGDTYFIGPIICEIKMFSKTNRLGCSIRKIGRNFGVMRKRRSRIGK